MFKKLWALIRSPRLARASDALGRDSILSAPLDSPEVLDQLWSHFGETGDLMAVRRIVSVLDGKDVVRGSLQTWLAQTHNWAESRDRDYQQLLIRCAFPIDYEKRLIDGPVDLDLHVAVLARSGELKFDELPIKLSPQDVVHLAMKTVAEQNQLVARLCHEESLKPGGAARQQLANF